MNDSERAKRRVRDGARCRFCHPDAEPLDYKNLALMQRVVTPQGKLYSRKRAGVCGYHQRRLKLHAKYARYLALLPTT